MENSYPFSTESKEFWKQHVNCGTGKIRIFDKKYKPIRGGFALGLMDKWTDGQTDICHYRVYITTKNKTKRS